MSRLARKGATGEIGVVGAMTDYLIASLSMPGAPIPVIIVLNKIDDLIAANFFEGDRCMSFHIRDATPHDISALAALHVQTFNETHRGGRSGGPTYELRERQWRDALKAAGDNWFCLVIEDDSGELVGFAKGTPHDGGVPGFEAELNKIYLLRRVQRQGLGRLLLCHVAHRFLSRGITSMLLFGEATNPSNGFYEAFGAERLYDDTGQFHGAYGWRDVQKLVKECDRV